VFTRVVGKRLALGAATFAAGLGLVMSLAPAAAACSDHGGRMPWGAWGAPQQAVAALPFAWHHSSPMLLPQDAWGDPCDQLAPLAAPAAAPVAALQHPAALHPNRHHRGRHHVRHHHRRHHHFRTHHLQGRHLAGHRQAHLYAVRHLALRHYLVRNHALFAPAQTGFRVAPAGLVLMQPLHANHAAAHHYGARHHRVRHHGHHGHHRHHHRRHRG
jgi:hypothetical protein